MPRCNVAGWLSWVAVATVLRGLSALPGGPGGCVVAPARADIAGGSGLSVLLPSLADPGATQKLSVRTLSANSSEGCIPSLKFIV